MLQNSARSIFLPFFFYLKNKKAGPREKWCEFYFFILLVAQLLLRTDTIPYRPIFIYKRLFVL